MSSYTAIPNGKTNTAWLFKMAWRDSRRNRSRLLLFISAIILGIAALVAVYSFRDNLQRDIAQQASVLAAADLTLESRKEPDKNALAMINSLGDERAAERSFASMIYFVKNDSGRLVQIRALAGGYPFYGKLETLPLKASTNFMKGKMALVDKTLMLQYGAKVGDSIKIGSLNFVIEGALEGVPGQTGISATISPVVYIPLAYLNDTGLNKNGSRIQYRYFYKFNKPEQVEGLVKKLDTQLNKYGLEAETIESKKADTGRSFRDVNRFLALSGFVALLLGCIGVGSAIHVYIGQKLSAIATLRCLGIKSWQAFLIYLIQILFIGLIGAVIGAALGTLIQFLLPAVLKDFIPVEITLRVSWSAIYQGISLGIAISILFALPSLLQVRRISPLNALRLSVEHTKQKFDPLKWFVYMLILIFIFCFSYLQVDSWSQAAAFTLGILIAFALLYALSKFLMWLVRTLMPASFSYLWRQGFANLYRPNNQTVMLTVSIGLSTAFICTLFFVQGILLKRVTMSSGEKQPNMVIFDIQNDQKEAVESLIALHKLPVLSQVPIVTVRIAEINGRSADQIAREDSLTNASRALRSELRVTFQKQLTAAETIVSGRWTGVVAENDSAVYVSLEEGYARRTQLKLGDSILFNVQGVMIPTVVGSIRAVDWGRMQTNFRVVFPTGVLEEAPQFHVRMTHVPSREVSANFQAAVVRKFPNVSIIDLNLVLKVFDEVLSKIGFVIRFMAGFSMATGWIVLVSAVLTSRNQRLQESILLRTLGASRKQIIAITALEYLFLGALATGAGMILAMGGSWALAKYVFDTTFSPPFWPVLEFLVAICLIVLVTGILSNRSVLNRPPLEILNG